MVLRMIQNVPEQGGGQNRGGQLIRPSGKVLDYCFSNYFAIIRANWL